MKVSRNFVKVFLALFLIVIVSNVISFMTGFYTQYSLYIFGAFFTFFWILFFRKKLQSEDYRVRFFTRLVTIMVVGLVLFLIIGFAPKTSTNTRYEFIDTRISNSTGMNMPIFYKQSSLFTISAWEGRIAYDDKEDRVGGSIGSQRIITDEQGNEFVTTIADKEIRLQPLIQGSSPSIVGWFQVFPTIQEKTSLTQRKVSGNLVDLDGKIKSASYHYTFYRKKPYFRLDFEVDAQDNSLLGKKAYGLTIRDYDLYLPNGTIVKNDHEVLLLNETKQINLAGQNNVSEEILNQLANITDLNQEVRERKGSIFEHNSSDYQIFFNSDRNITLIFKSENVSNWRNSFYWNVYWIYVKKVDGKYPPLYGFIFEDSELSFNDGWEIKSKYYSGRVDQYINKSIELIN